MTSSSTVWFASVRAVRPEADATLPAKLQRLLRKVDLASLCKGRWTPIKMHLGGRLGYSTIHPLLVRMVVQAVKDAGGKPFVTEGGMGAVAEAAARGYTAETLGCPILPAGGPFDRDVVEKPIGFKTLDSASIFGAIARAECLINLSHVKGHGDCGYGGACKNLAMGCVDAATRAKIHALEGGIEWKKDVCVFCGRCAEACDTGAISVNRKEKRFRLFYHHCRYCRHCISVCPAGALSMKDRQGFRDFQEGMALATRAVLEPFQAGRVFHINILTQITMFCDCWGMTTPHVVPDIGLMASDDVVALETASLEAIKTKDFLPGSLIGKWKLGRGRHLFEKIHGKDPWVQVRALERHGLGSRNYTLKEVV